jgi:hypothetical protein
MDQKQKIWNSGTQEKQKTEMEGTAIQPVEAKIS